MNTLEQVNFDIIRYANCWEDADVLLDPLRKANARRIAIIASAGDNALALLTLGPEAVLAFDISLPQLYLAELKQVAFSRLAHEEVLVLLGVAGTQPAARLHLAKHLETHLSPGAKVFFQNRPQLIAGGLIHCGKFERYFRLFRKYCLPLVHRRSKVRALLLSKPDDAQAAFYHSRWNNWRWQALMQLFFSKRVMGGAGRDPQFLKQVDIPVPQYIRRKAETHLQRSAATSNYLLHYIFTGEFGGSLPCYLRAENFDAVRSNIGRLTLQHATAENVVRKQEHEAYCLSNIFEYFPHSDFAATVASWRNSLRPGAHLLFWNLMAPRSFSTISPDSFHRIAQQAERTDVGFFYSAFLHEQKL